MIKDLTYGCLDIPLESRNNVRYFQLSNYKFLGKRGMPFRLNNRLDIKDKNNRFLEGRIIEFDRNMIKVTFKGYSCNYDEWLDLDNEQSKIYEIGAFSGSHGYGKS